MLVAVVHGPPPEPAPDEWRFISDDQIAIRAPHALVMDTLVDAHGWHRWWPQVRWYPNPPALLDSCTGDAHVDCGGLPSPPHGVIEVVDGWLLLLRATLTPHHYRPGIGWRWHVGGDADVLSEIWLEAAVGSVIVHHLMWEGACGQHRGAARWRRTVRAGLWALKDHSQACARKSVGLLP